MEKAFWRFHMKKVKALVLTGYGLNCDNETDYSLHLAGADSRRMHINELINKTRSASADPLGDYRILVFGGGFSWADDHGAGVLMASKMKRHLGEQLKAFVDRGNLVLGICNGFQALVNLGLLPGFDGRYQDREVALTHNDSGNFMDAWVALKVNPRSPNVFTKGISRAEFPIRHGEGKFFATDDTVDRLFQNDQVVLQYADLKGEAAEGRWPMNPNGSLSDIAGIAIPPVASSDSCRTRKPTTISPIIRTGPGESWRLPGRAKELNRKRARESPSFEMQWNTLRYKAQGIKVHLGGTRKPYTLHLKAGSIADVP
jgi:phosphoribosylformylglycinamidine (FGAM) synthase-like amidotransferase family enzyme